MGTLKIRRYEERDFKAYVSTLEKTASWTDDAEEELTAMMKKMTETSGWKEKYLKQYMLSAGWMGSKDFTQMVNQSETIFKDILKDLGLLK
jgi:tripartite-type tricarboxylate transporter receptor subunit TctC